jgi:cytochrome c oxidase subunit 1
MVITMSIGDSPSSWIGTVLNRPTQRVIALHWVLGLVLVVSVPLLSRALLDARTDVFLHDTYYVVAHFQYVLSLAVAFAFFATWYYLFPKVTGRHYSEVLAMLHFWLTALGVGLLLFVWAWLMSAPGRSAGHPEDFAYWIWWSSVGSYLAAAGTLVFIAATARALLVRGGHG